MSCCQTGEGAVYSELPRAGASAWRGALLAATLLATSGPAAAAFDEFADTTSPRHFELSAGDLRLVIKGEAELELHDIEGEGGARFDSVTDTRTLGTRSPFVEIDSFWLALRLVLPYQAGVHSIIELTQHSAAVTAVWADWVGRWPQALHHHIEIGYHTPFVKIDRRSERYPLSGTIYWREPELHAVWEGRIEPWRRTAIEVGFSAAMMRPLHFAPVQESTSQGGTVNVIGYGRARTFSGNAPVWGGKLHAESHGLFATLFGFVGTLAAQAGTDELRNSLSAYRDLPGYNAADPIIQDTTFYWWGGRLGYSGFGVHAVVEAVASRESLLRRYGGYGQISYAWRLPHPRPFLHTIEPLVRYEVYRISDAAVVQPSGRALRSPAPSQAITWDWTILTVGVIVGLYRDIFTLRLEYYVIDEANGVPDLAIADQPFTNNELLVQLEMRF